MNDIEHRQGCPALPGYGHAPEPCTCGAAAPAPDLPPCPFCGAKLHEYEHSFVHPHPSPANGFCLIAGLSFRRDQLDFWSRRATAAKDAEIDALRTRLEDTVRDSTNKIETLRAEVERLAKLCNELGNDWVSEMEACKRAEAEVEALREQLAEARDGWHMANGTAELAMKHRDDAEARAERLAEALRELRNHTSVNSDQIALIDAALEQEAGRHTSLGERLRALRQQAIDGGMELQSEADIVKGLGRENDDA